MDLSIMKRFLKFSKNIDLKLFDIKFFNWPLLDLWNGQLFQGICLNFNCSFERARENDKRTM